MKERKTIRNIAAALGAFVLWGNLVGLLLPAEEHGAVVGTLDFAAALFLTAILAAACAAILRQRKTSAGKKEDGGTDA